MRLAINNPAPIGPNLDRWGDYHFGLGVQRELEALGVAVDHHFWPNWDKASSAEAVLVIRGKRRWQPRPEQRSMLWVISHPSTVAPGEMDQYSVTFVASDTLRQRVIDQVTCRVEVMRQCTDRTRFEPDRPTPMAERRGIVFVANSRGVRRNVIAWAVEAGMQPDIIGRHWDKHGLRRLVRQNYLANEELPSLYHRARLSLNDHWGDMLHAGMVNNRIFDCLAAGVPTLTDDFPELRQVCGDALLYADSPASLMAAMTRYTLRYPELLERTAALWDRIGDDYSFRARAEQIKAVMESPLVRRARPAAMPTSEGLAGQVRVLLDERHGVARVLHYAPIEASACVLSSLDGIDYVSCGPGYGPWHVALDREASAFVARDFDVLIVEGHGLRWRNERGESSIDRLIERLHPGGVVLVSPAMARSCGKRLARRDDLVPAAAGDGWSRFNVSPDDS